jgi:deazaflavin-dependent oxidoreductase (nitroreductase family)
MSDDSPSTEAMTTEQIDDWNNQVIADFRANAGQVTGQFAGAPMVLVHTKGARSGQPRVSPMVYLRDGERYLVFASKAGADTNPAWYHNLVSAPTARIEVGPDTFDVKVEELHGEERDRLYAKQAGIMPNFAEYQEKTKRVIPVIALTKI